MVLVLVDLRGAGVNRSAVETIDPSRSHARIVFANTPAEALGSPGGAEALLKRVQDRAAVLFAFEQVGGAQRSLDMARDYALQRYAFGRPIGSFQAIKHKLADVYVATELARSNAYYGAWALARDAAELPLAAASARISANEAYFLAAKENIQVHGGMGYTWEYDCHLHYRRAKLLSLTLGSTRMWKDRLITQLESANAPL
jgi:alkylation response protein AidB-like acyl-CoA dehydrogenase